MPRNNSRSDDVARVLAQYRQTAGSPPVESLGSAGGFSGARFWRITTDAGQFCLRRWPTEHPTPDRLAYIHRVLLHVAGAGFATAATPIQTFAGQTYCLHGDHLWELTPWLPGTADYHRAPRRERLIAAMRTLAEFHLAAATSPGGDARVRPSPGISERRETLRELLSGGSARIQQSIVAADWPQLAERAGRLLTLFHAHAAAVLRQLEHVSPCQVPLQPCIRDVWHDHVLFTGDEVTGLIDFGAMRGESVAGDVARLLASFVGDDREGWRVGLQAYQSRRRLAPDELSLVAAFDRSGVLLSGLNWLKWIYVEQRRFADRETVVARLDDILGRLEHEPSTNW